MAGGPGSKPRPAAAVVPAGQEVKVGLTHLLQRRNQVEHVDAGADRPGRDGGDVEEEAHRRAVYEGAPATPPGAGGASRVTAR